MDTLQADGGVQPWCRQNLFEILLGLGKLVVKLEKLGNIAEEIHRVPRFGIPR